MINERESEVILNDILKRSKCRIVDLDDMRKLYKDVLFLLKMIEESGNNKIGNDKCRMMNYEELEGILRNILVRIYNMKLGI